MALLLWYGGLRVLDGTLTVGVLAAFIQYTRRFFQPLQDLSEKFNLLQSAMASSERVFAPARRAGDGERAGCARRRCRGRCGGRSASRGSGSAIRPTDRGCCKDITFTAPPRPDACAGGPHGGGEDHDRQPAAPLLRPRAGPDHRGRGGHPGAFHRGAPIRDRIRAAGPLPLHRRHPAQPHAGRARFAAQAARAAAERVGADRFIERLPPATSIGWASGAGTSAWASGSS